MFAYSSPKKADEMLSSVLRNAEINWSTAHREDNRYREVFQVIIEGFVDNNYFIFELDENGYAHIWKHWTVDVLRKKLS